MTTIQLTFNRHNAATTTHLLHLSHPSWRRQLLRHRALRYPSNPRRPSHCLLIMHHTNDSTPSRPKHLPHHGLHTHQTLPAHIIRRAVHQSKRRAHKVIHHEALGDGEARKLLVRQLELGELRAQAAVLLDHLEQPDAVEHAVHDGLVTLVVAGVDDLVGNQVLPDRRGAEDNGFLRDHGEEGRELVAGDVAHFDAVDGDGAGVGDEGEEGECEGRFAAVMRVSWVREKERWREGDLPAKSADEADF